MHLVWKGLAWQFPSSKLQQSRLSQRALLLLSGFLTWVERLMWTRVKKRPKIKSPHKCPWPWRGQIHHLERWFPWIHHEEILPLWQYDTNRVRNIITHCHRQNGPESWVLLTKVKSLGHIASSYNLDQISSSESPLSESTSKSQPNISILTKLLNI